jgi:hypothetical protein
MNILRIVQRVRTFVARKIGDRRDRTATSAARESPPVHADERTIRRMAEAELGGISSAQSRAAYLRGDNPGGLHQGGRGPAPIHHDEDVSAYARPLDLSEPIIDDAPKSSVSTR